MVSKQNNVKDIVSMRTQVTPNKIHSMTIFYWSFNSSQKNRK